MPQPVKQPESHDPYESHDSPHWAGEQLGSQAPGAPPTDSIAGGGGGMLSTWRRANRLFAWAIPQLNTATIAAATIQRVFMTLASLLGPRTRSHSL